MTSFTRIKRITPSNLFMAVGLVLTLLIVMFRPAGAEAVLPTEAKVFDKFDSNSGATVKYSDLQKYEADYDVIPNGKKTAVKAHLSGIPLVEFLKKASASLDNVGFAKVTVGSATDGYVVLLPLNQESSAGRPAMVLDSGSMPGRGALKSPQLIPGQPTDTPLSENQFAPFNRKTQELSIAPSQPGAKIMSVRISSKKTSKGEYKLSAKVTAGSSGGALKYQWFAADKDGTGTEVCSQKSTCTTTDATSGTKQRVVNLVVTETGSGSTGVRSFGYTSKKPDDGKTTKPKSDSGTGTGGDGTGTGGPGAGGPGTPGNNGVFPTPTPPPSRTVQPYVPPGTNQTQPNTTPPPVTSTTPPDQSTQQNSGGSDTSGITNIAQNISGAGDFVPVSGVLLAAPTVAPGGGGESGGDSSITELPAPVATELDSIFQPVDDAEDLWPYLLAILFATCLAGAVREWVNP